MRKTSRIKEVRVPSSSVRDAPLPLGVTAVLNQVLIRVRTMVANGLFSERALAAAIGMSQPHVHHLLSGDRTLTAPVADLLLDRLAIPLAEILDELEVSRELESVRLKREPKVWIPALSGRIGPRGPLPQGAGLQTSNIELVECRLVAGLAKPSLVNLGPDPEMAPMLDGLTHAILNETPEIEAEPSALYAVAVNGVLLARGIRIGRRSIYLLTANSWNHPSQWQRVPKTTPFLRLTPIRSDRLSSQPVDKPAAAAAS